MEFDPARTRFRHFKELAVGLKHLKMFAFTSSRWAPQILLVFAPKKIFHFPGGLFKLMSERERQHGKPANSLDSCESRNPVNCRKYKSPLNKSSF